MNSKIPIYIPSLPTYKKLEPYLLRIDESRQYTNFGPLEMEVRERFAEYLGLPLDNIVTCANATLGLEGALETIESTEVWNLPSWTFSATASAVLRTKSYGRFVDVDDEWRALISSDTANLIDVLPFGQPIGPLDRYQSGAIQNLVIDAAAAFDSLRNVDLPPNVNSCGVISLHATKVIPSGEGGLFFSNSAEWAESFRAWTRFGMHSGRISEDIGTNAKLSEYHSAVLLASLDSWEKDRLKWLEQKERAKELTEVLGFKFEPINSSLFATPYWIISSDDQNRIRRVKEIFTRDKIQTREWWESGCHKMSAYKDFKYENLDRTDSIAANSIGLPFWKEMSSEVWKRIEISLMGIS